MVCKLHLHTGENEKEQETVRVEKRPEVPQVCSPQPDPRSMGNKNENVWERQRLWVLALSHESIC